MPANAGKRMGDHAPKTTIRRKCGSWHSKACVIGKRDQAGAHVVLARVAHVTDTTMPLCTNDPWPAYRHTVLHTSGA